ncbi:hypothetical protein CC1G_03184 [Coprinopsis cinerea okayama7|uniref:Antigenic cell wall galactomannoprotein n=1 Tax=Coprinopsis cinerea (strain Okayama-7 / 130 / ATCC MYA-4618 / FGSC 9003) TaxID=240176 RepID=A8PF84_COPC7|nr:hypothetical protein CC1G_03184 [Coprinopsis cinerea okayama7\|eukprot:XP_001840955.1 hypothetical protein CC1G_03184 [Coprinopsis cinerea okayama7\
MFFVRSLLAFVAVSVASTLFASATPVVEKTQDLDDVLTVVAKLKVATDLLLPEIDTLVNRRVATEANISPLLAKLAFALDASTDKLELLSLEDDAEVGGTDEQVAREVATVYGNIVTSLDNLKTNAPEVYSATVPMFGLDKLLLKLLLTLKTIVADALKLIGELLKKTIGGLLGPLGLILTRLLLGIL